MEFELAAFATAPFEGISAVDFYASVGLVGEGILDVEATTVFVDLVETNRAKFTYAAEINLRQL